jgi:hypothetical protein
MRRFEVAPGLKQLLQKANAPGSMQRTEVGIRGVDARRPHTTAAPGVSPRSSCCIDASSSYRSVLSPKSGTTSLDVLTRARSARSGSMASDF